MVGRLTFNGTLITGTIIETGTHSYRLAYSKQAVGTGWANLRHAMFCGVVVATWLQGVRSLLHQLPDEVGDFVRLLLRHEVPGLDGLIGRARGPLSPKR